MYNRFYQQALKSIFIIACMLICQLLSDSPIQAANDGSNDAGAESKRVCLILLDYINLTDLKYAKAPNIHRLISQGAIGLMNTNTGGTKTPENTFLTIGTGARSRNTALGTLALNGDETYNRILGSEVFQSRTGIELPLHSIGVPNLSIIMDANKNLNYEVEVGMLGNALRNAGLHVAVIGNSDTEGNLRRFGTLIGMNHQGIIDYGNVSQQVLLKTPSSPSGYVSYYERMFREVSNVWDKASLIIIELGDIARLEQYKNVTMEDVFLKHKQDEIERADAFIGELLSSLGTTGTMVILTSPTPPSSALANGDIFTPCIVWEENMGSGLLTSETTRRPGIVTNIDIPATILSYLELDVPPSVLGRNMYVLSAQAQIKTLEHISLVSVSTYRDRPPIIQTYIGMQIIVLVGAVIVILTNRWRNHFIRRLLLYALFSLGLVPFVLLLLPMIPAYSLGLRLLYTVVIVILLTTAALRFSQQELDPILWITLPTAVALLADVFAGSPLQKTSILGYCPIIGGRFYGIGNEYMGILMGAVLIGSTALLDRFQRNSGKLRMKNASLMMIVVALYAITTYAVGSPALGANVGGSIVAAIALTYTLSRLIWKRRAKTALLYGVAAVLIVVTIFAIIDLNRATEAQSHLAKALQLIKARGIDVIREIVFRKLAANIKIFKYTIWTRVLLLSLGILAVLFYKPPNYLQTSLSEYPNVAVGLVGSLIASGAGLAFNDSGVAPAATAILFAMVTTVSLVLQEEDDLENNLHERSTDLK